jgi:abhydrolase domain-containing protein 12
MIAAVIDLYATMLALLTRSTLQYHAVYLHAIQLQLTWFKDLNVPEQFGFLKNQVTPFSLRTPDGER